MSDLDLPAGVDERHWRAMGSDAHVVVVGGPPGLVDAAVERIATLEHLWSRFLPESEISLLNRAAPAALRLSPATVLLVRTAVDAWRTSGGAFEPLVLGALEAAGYDRSFEQLAPDRAEHDRPPGWATVPACSDIRLFDDGAALPAGARFDAGGIGKGLGADLVAQELIERGASGACVNLGGDVRVVGVGPHGDGWTVAISHPATAEPLAVVGLTDGAVATSSTLRRSWSVGGDRRHHLIDPSTGEPAQSDVELAAVIAGSTWRAEVLAKAALLRGAARCFDLLEPGDAGLVVTTDGEVLTDGSFLQFCGDRTPMGWLDHFDRRAA